MPRKNKKHTTHIDLTEGPIHQHLIRMALPMIVGVSASMTFLLADTYFIGKLGPTPLAAMGFISPIVMIIVSASIGLSAGASSIMARASGRKDQDELVKIATNSIIISVLISFFFTVIGLLTIDPLFTMMGADDTTLHTIRIYMHIWYWSPVFIIVPMVAMGAMRAMGDTTLQGKLMIIGAIFNVIIDPILIFGLLGFPRMGIAGAALATLIARAGTLVAVIYYLTYRFEVLKFSSDIFSHFKQSFQKIAHVGIPAMGTNMIIPVAGGIVIAVIAIFGNNAVAGANVAMRIESILIIIFLALSAVIGPFAGQNIGAGRVDRLEIALKLLAIFALFSGVFMALASAYFAPFITIHFSDEPSIQNVANHYLYIMPISYGAYGFVMIANATFNGIGKPLPGVIISTLRVVIFQLPLVLIAAYFFPHIEYIFAASCLSNILAGIIAYIWIMKYVRDMATS